MHLASPPFNEKFNPLTTVCKVVQINLQTSYAKTLELIEYIRDNKIGIALLQEPYNKIGVQRSRYPDYQFVGARGVVQSCILVHESLDILYDHATQDPCHAICYIEQVKSFVVSSYFKYSDQVEKHTDILRDMLGRLVPNADVVLGADTNAHSPLWHSDIRDSRARARGSQVETFINEQALHIVNRMGQPPTFRSHVGSSTIDVTLATSKLARRIDDWIVDESVSTSDHNAITFSIASDSIKKSDEKRFLDISRFNWRNFKSSVARVVEEMKVLPCDSHEDIDAFVAKLEHELVTAMTANSKSKTYTHKTFWNKELGILKKEITKILSKISRCYAPYRRSELIEEVAEKRKTYKAAIQNAKMKSFKEHIKRYRDTLWGPAYKALKEKRVNLKSLPSFSQEMMETGNITGNLNILLDNLFPADKIEEDTPEDTEVRREVAAYTNSKIEHVFNREEIELALKQIRPKKAPGEDGILPSIVKGSSDVLVTLLEKLFNACLRLGYFPMSYKSARVILLYKGPPKDPSVPKSYRPICLLKTLSKVLERLMIDRIHHYMAPVLSDNQYGFTKGKSTEDAVSNIVSKVRLSSKNLVLMVSLDVGGAFDHAWWPAILKTLADRGIPGNLYRLAASFLDRRKINASIGNVECSRVVNRGCPQGSVSGPKFWNYLFNDLLTSFNLEGCSLSAYADDLALLVEDVHQAPLLERVEVALNVVFDWGKTHHINFNPSKTEAVLLKEGTHSKRYEGTRVKTSSHDIPLVPTLKYLGFILARRLNMNPHVKYITDKAAAAFSAFCTFNHHDWGLSRRHLRVIYRGIFESTITYCASVLYGSLDKRDIGRTLGSAQRQALMHVIKPFSTVPTLYLPILACVLPVRELMKQRALNYFIRTDQIVSSRTDTYRMLLEDIQLAWTLESEHVKLRRYIPSVIDHYQRGCMVVDRSLLQLVTDHGNFPHRLNQFNPSRFPLTTCHCGVTMSRETDSRHLYECSALQEQIRALMSKCQDCNIAYPPISQSIFDVRIRSQVIDLMQTYYEQRKEIEVSEDRLQSNGAFNPPNHMPIESMHRPS